MEINFFPFLWPWLKEGRAGAIRTEETRRLWPAGRSTRASSLASIGEGMTPSGRTYGPTTHGTVAWDRSGRSPDISDAVLCEVRPYFVAALSLFRPKTAEVV